MSSSDSQRITILHFNDVYNIEAQKSEPVGGVDRFLTALNSHRDLQSLTLFSGDAFSPSILGTVTQGKHLVPILNLLGIDCAVLGNHDFDFGVDNLLDCMEGCNFPWLNSNCYERATNEMLAQAKRFQVVERAGLRLGIIGLVEPEWVATLSMVDEDDLEVRDFCEEGRQLALELKTGWEGQRKCDLVFALTHMRWPNDRRLAETVPEIDLILGGHDHNHGVEQINGRYVVKSGTDFRHFSRITLDIASTMLESVSVELISVDSSWTPDPQLESLVRENMSELESRMCQVLGRVETALDARFEAIRAEETNLGNWITDVMLTAVDADLALLNSGSLRADCLFAPGEFTLGDLHRLLPYMDSIIVLQTTGHQVLQTLENGVSQWPKLEGRFLQVSGVEFTFEPSRPALERIDPKRVRIQGAPLDLQADYRMCVMHFMAHGKDGFGVLTQCPVLLDDENGPILSISVQNYFRRVAVLRGFRHARTLHRQSLLSRCRRRTIRRSAITDEKPCGTPQQPPPISSSSSMSALDHWAQIRNALVENEERDFLKISPKIEGRITRIVE